MRGTNETIIQITTPTFSRFTRSGLKRLSSCTRQPWRNTPSLAWNLWDIWSSLVRRSSNETAHIRILPGFSIVDVVSRQTIAWVHVVFFQTFPENSGVSQGSVFAPNFFLVLSGDLSTKSDLTLSFIDDAPLHSFFPQSSPYGHNNDHEPRVVVHL